MGEQTLQTMLTTLGHASLSAVWKLRVLHGLILPAYLRVPLRGLQGLHGLLDVERDERATTRALPGRQGWTRSGTGQAGRIAVPRAGRPDPCAPLHTYDSRSTFRAEPVA